MIGVDAELDESSVDDVTQCEERIVSQWRKISADEQNQLRKQFDEIVRPLGYQTRLVVLDRANSLALVFTCMTLPAVKSLRHQWSSGKLKDIVQSLFAFLSAATYTVRVKKLAWPLTEYKRSTLFFSFSQGKPTTDSRSLTCCDNK